jgi:hypothetical protein
MQRMRTVERGRGTWKTINMMKGRTSGMLDERVYPIDFFKLSKISLPSSTPFTIEEKLSSSKSMSAAFLATSEPEPIAIPISAFLIAGESFTPSPVTATT